MNVAYVLAVALVLSGVCTFGYLVASEVLLAWIKRGHMQTFKELGEPSLFGNNTISNGNRVIRFLLDKEYLPLGEARISRLGGVTRFLFLAGVASFAIALIAFVAQTVQFHRG